MTAKIKFSSFATDLRTLTPKTNYTTKCFAIINYDEKHVPPTRLERATPNLKDFRSTFELRWYE